MVLLGAEDKARISSVVTFGVPVLLARISELFHHCSRVFSIDDFQSLEFWPGFEQCCAIDRPCNVGDCGYAGAASGARRVLLKRG